MMVVRRRMVCLRRMGILFYKLLIERLRFQCWQIIHTLMSIRKLTHRVCCLLSLFACMHPVCTYPRSLPRVHALIAVRSALA